MQQAAPRTERKRPRGRPMQKGLPKQPLAITLSTKRSAALAEATHVALHAPLGVLELRSAVRARADERLGTVVERELCLLASGGTVCYGDLLAKRRRGGRTAALAQQVLLYAELLLLIPVVERDTDCVGYREHLVRPEADRAVGRDAAELLVDLHERNP